jgi:hypothetical protein
VHLAEEANEILRRPVKAIDRPCCDDVELAARNALQQLIEPWPAVATLGAADPLVDVLGDDAPAVSTV